MSFDYKALSHSLMDYECLRRYTVHSFLHNSGVYFGQPPVLDYLIQNGTSTQNEIAKALGVSPASMAMSVKRMQKSGLIEKVNDESDLRCNKITITESGKKQAKNIHSRFDELDKKMYDGFSEEELNSLKSFIDRMTENLSADVPDKRELYVMMKENMHNHGGDEK